MLKNKSFKSFIIAPSKYVSKKILKNAQNRLNEIGISCAYEEDILSKEIYFAGSVKRRIQEIKKAFSDKESSIVFCLRGGYASMELLDNLPLRKLSISKKTFVGHSDITALLWGFYLNKYKGLLVHGQMPGSKNWNDSIKFKKLYLDCLNGRNYKIKLPKSVVILNNKNFNGRIVGGNLRIITHMLGTHYEPNFDNKVVFLEDVREKPAAIYTMLLQLQLCGKFKKIKGLLLGDFPFCGNYQPLLMLFIQRFRIPVLAYLPLGHSKLMFPIRFDDEVSYNSKSKTLLFSRKNK